jgi:hypothetical protein
MSIKKQNTSPSTDSKKDNKKKEDDWMQKQWRPMMAMMYMTVCAFDFIIFPIMYTIVQFWEIEASNDAFRQWQPLTLIGAGLFHMAMGAILGITAYGRTQEKLSGMAVAAPSANDATPPPNVPVTPQTNINSFAPVSTGFGGKAAPPDAFQPVL